MTIKILVDMNLSPDWVPALERETLPFYMIKTHERKG
jgi:hypothetical protein